jgi:hypothetical protein
VAVETADDRLIMLADFGVAATYTPSGGSASSITVIFDNAYEAVDTGGGVSFAVRQPRVTARTADVPNASEGDTLAVEGVTYVIRIVMPDGTGITELMLEAP